MIRNVKKRSLFYWILILLMAACVEPYDFSTESLEKALVVEGFITDELKQQQVKLSTVYRLESEEPIFVETARVVVVSDRGDKYNFYYQDEGIYVSEEPFRAESNVNYHIEIESADGSTYTSEEEALVGQASIEKIYAEQQKDNSGEVGAAIFIDNSTLSEENMYYKYSYEETYKIQSPYKSDFRLAIGSDGAIQFEKVTKERTICYVTSRSDQPVLVNTSNLTTKNLDRELINFINLQDRKIWFRYSVLVKQMVLNKRAYNYFELLQELSGVENIFSQNQPGFLIGNLVSVSNPDEKVVGYFGVSSVQTKRLSFSFTDIFSKDERPSLIKNCAIERPSGMIVYGIIADEKLEYVGDAGEPDERGDGPYLMVPPPCIDCTLLGTNKKPEFWED